MEFPIKLYKALIWLTLYGAALHFFDNYYFFDQYPEPAWLRAEITAALWIPLALLAHRAVDYIYAGKISRSFWLVHGFVLANWITLGHYLFASPTTILPRINFGIVVEVGLATLLLAVTLWLQFTRYPESLRWTRRAWVKNVATYAIAIVILETIWPSKFDWWWIG